MALAGLWPAAEAAHAAIRAAAEAESELADSRQLLLEASERAAEAREAAGAAAATYQELLATVGTAVEELQRRLAEVTGALGRLKTSERDARQREQGALEARGKADGKQGELRTQVEDAARQRDATVREFQAFAATGLLRVAVTSLEIPDVEQPWAATPTVKLAWCCQRRTRLRGRRGRAMGPDPEAGDRGAQAAGGRDGHARALGGADAERGRHRDRRGLPGP